MDGRHGDVIDATCTWGPVSTDLSAKSDRLGPVDTDVEPPSTIAADMSEMKHNDEKPNDQGRGQGQGASRGAHEPQDGGQHEERTKHMRPYEITEAQRNEILEMEWLIEDIRAKCKATTVEEVEDRALPAYE